jgi:hypothetical protein
MVIKTFGKQYAGFIKTGYTWLVEECTTTRTEGVKDYISLDLHSGGGSATSHGNRIINFLNY